MQTIAVFVDDAAHARRLLLPLLEGASPPTRWLLVACPPPLTRHIGRFVSRSARHQWRARWAAELLAELMPELKRGPSGHRVERCTAVAGRPLAELAQRLTRRHAGLRLLDARAPRWGATLEPLPSEPLTAPRRWLAPLTATAGLSVMLVLAD